MGLFDFLFGRGKSKLQSPALDAHEAEAKDGWLTLDKFSWFGAVRSSPSGQWMISWNESGYVVRDGIPTRPNGSWLLYEPQSKRVVKKGVMTCLSNGAVADNGTFVLVDMTLSNALQCTFYAFDAQGSCLMKRRLNALIMTTAISNQGRYALCMTASSPSDDGNSMFLFELATGAPVFSTTPATGWNDIYTIDDARGDVVVHSKKLGTFHYDKTGAFLDSEALQEATLRHGEYSGVFMTAEHILKSQPSLERMREVLMAIERAFEAGGNRDPGWKATGLKLKGIAHEGLGEDDAAIVAYEEALALNQKIGVKRRLTFLLKRKA